MSHPREHWPILLILLAIIPIECSIPGPTEPTILECNPPSNAWMPCI